MSTQEDVKNDAPALIDSDSSNIPNLIIAPVNVDLIVQDSLLNMPAQPDERFLQGRIFDIRQRLIAQLMQDSLVPEDNVQTLDQQDISLTQEDLWRDMLPPLLLPTVRRIALFSAWRSALLAILGLILGFALGQALLAVELFTVFTSSEETVQTMQRLQTTHGTSITIIFGLLGVMGSLWLSEYFIQAKSRESISFFGNRYRWKPFTRFASITWFGILVIALVHDVFNASMGPLKMVQTIGVFLSTGQTLPFFSNVYGLLLFTFLFAAFLKRPLYFDHQDFEEKLYTSAQQWWAGARLIGPLLFENIKLKNDPTKNAWKKVGRELYSLAGELPHARQLWLEDRLRRLGIEATREPGKLLWSVEMSDRYTALGHIDLGDACYVDEPPLLENGLLVRKGTVRKVRK